MARPGGNRNLSRRLGLFGAVEGSLRRAPRRGALLGIDPDLHPWNFGGLGSYHDAIQKIPARYPLPGSLTLGQFIRFLEDNDGRYAVEWQENAGRPSIHLAA